MRIPGVKTAKILAKWLQGRLSGGALILGYHRIANPDHDEYEICVTPDHFTEHLDILQKHAHLIGVAELEQHLRQGNLPRKSVAITFDDGYADNLYNAKPLLEEYQIPATVFISTGYLGQEFWWDELERLVMRPSSLPRSLDLTIHGERFEWSAMRSGEKLRGAEERSSREDLIQSLYFHLRSLDVDERRNMMNEIKSWSGGQYQRDSAHRAITTNELLELANGGLLDIGAHTVTHPVLPCLSYEQQQEEIQQSKALLEELLGKPVSGFAYPHGKFTDETLAIVEATGFMYACSSKSELVWQRHQRYALPRIWPKDWDGDQFARRLRFWLGG